MVKDDLTRLRGYLATLSAEPLDRLRVLLGTALLRRDYGLDVPDAAA